MSMTLAAMTAALMAAQDATPPPAEDAAVAAVEVTATARVVGDLKTGVLGYPAAFFAVTRPSTALDMVMWLPGFVLEDTRDARGLEGSTGNVLIDGKPPTSKTDTLSSVLRRLPAEQVERVDLIVGGAPGVNMRGRNIVANVVLKASAKTPRTVTAQAWIDERGRTTPTLAATLSRKSEGRSVEMGFDLGRNIGIFPGFGYGVLTRRGRDDSIIFEADNEFLYGGPFATANMTYERPVGRGRLRVNGLARYYGTSGDERTSLRAGGGSYRYLHDEDYRQGEVGVRYERAFGRLNLEVQALDRPTHFTFRDQNDRPPTVLQFDVAGQSEERVARTVLRWKHNDRITLEAFGEGAFNVSETSTSAVTNGAPQVLPMPHLSAEERRAEAGVVANWKPSSSFSLDLALKGETSALRVSGDAADARDYAYAKPRLALSWSPDSNTQVRVRLEHEVGQVGLFSLVTISEINGRTRVGNPNLRPGRAIVGEVAVQRRFGVGGDASLTLRRSLLRDAADVAAFPSDDGLFQIFTNIGDGERTDLVVTATAPLKPLGIVGAMIKGGFTLSDMQVIDPTNRRVRPLSAQPEVIADLHFTHDFPQWRLNWGLDAAYRGRSTLYRPFGNEVITAWPRFAVFVERRFDPGIVLRVELQNLPGPILTQTVDYYAGLRDLTPLAYRDEKRLSNGTILFLRFRRTVG